MNKGLILNNYGTISDLSITDLPIPRTKKDMAVVKINAIGLNPRDLSILEGKFRIFTGRKFPKLIGADFSGEIVELPKGTKNFKIGDQVFGYYEKLNGGVSASYVQVPTKYLVKKPEKINDTIAASIGCTYLTAYQALIKKVNIKQGQSIIIYGAAGGVGTAAIHLAKNKGAFVTAVSHSRNLEFCMKQGADNFIPYNKKDVFNIDEKFDIFFQVFSNKGNLYTKAKSLINKNGTFIGLIPDPLLSLFGRFRNVKAQSLIVKSNQADLTKIINMVKYGVIKPNIDKVYSIKYYEKAYLALKEGDVKGKIVITFDKGLKQD